MKNELVIKLVLLKLNGFQRTAGINKWRYSQHLIYINLLFERKALDLKLPEQSSKLDYPQPFSSL